MLCKKIGGKYHFGVLILKFELIFWFKLWYLKGRIRENGGQRNGEKGQKQKFIDEKYYFGGDDFENRAYIWKFDI